MTFYDTYLSPGDLRARRSALTPRQTLHSTADKSTQTPLQILPNLAPARASPATRATRQNALFLTGLAGLSLAALLTRRSLRAKRLPTPSTFTPSNAPLPPVEAGLDAFEALSLATLSTVSVFATGFGAAAMWFDIADAEDLRERVRWGVGFDVYGGGGGGGEGDREIEEWARGVMEKRAWTDVEGMKEEVVGKLMEIEAREREQGKGEGKR
ncbi:hypothetical protein LTR95_012425 [Oleoguttula sp. CCFEE 5521]